ncbi:MAG: hypothetical protein RIQ56_480 [Candidatus Parcubacteria bacterium]
MCVTKLAVHGQFPCFKGRSPMRMIVFAATAATSVLLATPVFAGGPSGCPPQNTSPISPHCPAGWVRKTACVSDAFWAKCSGTWYASGAGVCTQRFFSQCGTFCMPPWFKGRIWRGPNDGGPGTAFVFVGQSPRPKKKDCNC